MALQNGKQPGRAGKPDKPEPGKLEDVRFDAEAADEADLAAWERAAAADARAEAREETAGAGDHG
ncbi:YfhD family protein [Paenibacillus thermoaerophilus]|uniref:YfhD family protein n=1 Tax=Paenibacillus thermoaerophilus TaxID=1215385 RepID=A0ABW2UXE8_9BACL|nr:YfhD family protein [Paenibacillus thermoaerophilus]TMV18997.1 YfhD family protein [Paenibacillus thermoaerophilus]